MRLTITSIADRGNSEKERIVIKVTADTDVGDYSIFRSKLNSSSKPTTTVTDVFWFPNKNVKAEDSVVLYTKSGTTTERTQESGRTVYFYYWGKKQPLWSSKSNYGAVLLHLDSWEMFKE